MGPAAHAGVMAAVKKGVGAMFIDVVKGEALFRVLPARGEFRQALMSSHPTGAGARLSYFLALLAGVSIGLGQKGEKI